MYVAPIYFLPTIVCTIVYFLWGGKIGAPILHIMVATAVVCFLGLLYQAAGGFFFLAGFGAKTEVDDNLSMIMLGAWFGAAIWILASFVAVGAMIVHYDSVRPSH